MRHRAQRYIRVGLLVGVIPTLVLLLIGLILRIIWPHGATGHQSFERLTTGLTRLEPAAFLSLGMLFLYVTPLIGAASALASFVAERDRRGALLTLAVLLVIFSSIIVGKR